MPGLILEAAAAVGDKVVNCSSFSKDVELTGPVQEKVQETFTLLRNATLWVAESIKHKICVYALRVTTLVGFSDQIFENKLQ